MGTASINKYFNMQPKGKKEALSNFRKWIHLLYQRNVTVCGEEDLCRPLYIFKAIQEQGISEVKSLERMLSPVLQPTLRKFHSQRLHLDALLLFALSLPFRVMVCATICTDGPRRFLTTTSYTLPGLQMELKSQN